ncbi:MAG: T9SS type A sorting domain-containing protein [Ignavibacteria bacterium]|nr:T9SS type A sorting domain-containing protein [Ignavibacteria bacterium]
MSQVQKLFVCFILMLFISSVVYAQNTEKYSQVRIYAVNNFDFQKLNNAGLHLDGGIYKPGYYFETWLSESEIKMLRSSGVSYQVTIDDWDTYYNNLPKMTPSEIQDAMNNSIRNFNVSHSIYGTMGGHIKWEEIIAKLDSLRLEYPNLVSQRFSIGSSFEDRQMWTVRITKNPDAPTGRPEIWYNGMTHAREPLSMSNVLYFVYWLVENYNIDPIATYILENREIYWTPIINPDGYCYNQSTNPNGGGMWRKNRKLYGSTYGVDLNRNFGTYNFWNSTNNGSSTSPSSDTYRGPNPFSEPETQNFRDFLNSRNFKLSLDYHTYGNLLIKPWAWCDPTPTPDDAVFNEYGNDIVAVNNYSFGTPYQTVGYYVRGGDIDWVYSSDSTGHSYHIFGMTPEVGTAGFWPAQNLILPQAQSCFHMNQYIALVAGPYVNVKSSVLNKTVYQSNDTGNMKVVFRNKGRTDAQNIKVEWIPVNTSYINIPVQIFTKPSLATFVSDSVLFNFTLSGVPDNFAIPTQLRIKQDDSVIVYSQNIYVKVGNGNLTFADSAENGPSKWTFSSGWQITGTSYHSPSNSFWTGSYPANANLRMTVVSPINVSATPVVLLSFWHKYYTEAGYDYCRVEVSNTTDTNWVQIASYAGNFQTWTYQSFDITDYANASSNLRIRFRLTSDGSLQYTGWYVDDIKLITYGTMTNVIEPALVPETYSLSQNYPNPFNPVTAINFTIPKQQFVTLKVYDILGREVALLVNGLKSPGEHTVNFDGSNFSSGIYYYRIESGDFTDVKKMILIK